MYKQYTLHISCSDKYTYCSKYSCIAHTCATFLQLYLPLCMSLRMAESSTTTFSVHIINIWLNLCDLFHLSPLSLVCGLFDSDDLLTGGTWQLVAELKMCFNIGANFTTQLKHRITIHFWKISQGFLLASSHPFEKKLMVHFSQKTPTQIVFVLISLIWVLRLTADNMTLTRH